MVYCINIAHSTVPTKTLELGNQRQIEADGVKIAMAGGKHVTRETVYSFKGLRILPLLSPWKSSLKKLVKPSSRSFAPAPR